MFAYLVAGAIVGVLVWMLRYGPGYPKLLTLLVFGLVGGAIGGLGANIIQGEAIDHIDGTGFAAAAVVALVLLVGVDVRVHRDDE